MKCSICNKKIEKTFLNKIKGAYIIKNSKRHAVCSECQKKYKDNISQKIE
ncbi:hypothetical protein GF327_00075 [Candidatus Woesearchaeota archaeon]|nr:hypothetical protein [Candidatus Woesearchaeota archaeon]